MKVGQKMIVIEKRLDELREYENNPRHNENAVAAVAASIAEFGFKQPIVIDTDGVIVAGHTRAKAAATLGMLTVPCIIADDLTEEQIRAFRLADNKTAELAAWDFDKLDMELAQLAEMDFDMTAFGFDMDFDADGDAGDEPEQERASLADEFIAPPFSVLDARQGYWQERKKMWKDMGIKSEDGRDAECLQSSIGEKYGRKQMTGVSIFDPVLCEIAYKWFCVDGGKIYDCFAGGSVRGIVASMLGYEYTGIDLRQEQVDANRANAAEMGVDVKWYCDDSLNADLYLQDESVDMIFSCPPYADLEVYSDDERDISNMEYGKFKEVYRRIIDIACSKLKQDRFAVFVVGDVRDNEGYYRNFVDYTKECFNANGLQTYNDMVLLDMLGTSMIRCKKPFNASRKVTKVHQNVLVFYKGDVRKIKDNFGAVIAQDFAGYDAQ
jgi:16S rRNA G966 N2-methylase RsmD